MVIRQMTADDLNLGRHLVAEAGWNQLDTDWLRAMELEPAGCFVAELNGVPCATTTTCCFDNVGWIAMVLVDVKMRGQGIAKQLVEHAVAYLENRNMETIRLDATVFGQGLYQKLGFQEEYEVVRFSGALNGRDKSWELFDKVECSSAIQELDLHVTGTRRALYLESLITNVSCPFYMSAKSGEVIGYAGCRDGRNAFQIGPAAAFNAESGKNLLNAVTSQFAGRNAFIDIPVQNASAVSWANVNGFSEQRRFVRMYRGEKVSDFPELMWASSGPEKG